MQIQKYKIANAEDAKKIQIAADIRLVLGKVQFKLDRCFAGIVPVIQYKLDNTKALIQKMQKLEITELQLDWCFAGVATVSCSQ